MATWKLEAAGKQNGGKTAGEQCAEQAAVEAGEPCVIRL